MKTSYKIKCYPISKVIEAIKKLNLEDKVSVVAMDTLGSIDYKTDKKSYHLLMSELSNKELTNETTWKTYGTHLFRKTL